MTATQLSGDSVLDTPGDETALSPLRKAREVLRTIRREALALDETDRSVHWIGRVPDAATGAEYRLRVPLKVELVYDNEDKAFIAFCPVVMSSGAGATSIAALDDLAASILAVRADLEAADDSTLATDSLELKRRLRNILQ